MSSKITTLLTKKIETNDNVNEFKLLDETMYYMNSQFGV